MLNARPLKWVMPTNRWRGEREEEEEGDGVGERERERLVTPTKHKEHTAM